MVLFLFLTNKRQTLISFQKNFSTPNSTCYFPFLPKLSSVVQLLTFFLISPTLLLTGESISESRLRLISPSDFPVTTYLTTEFQMLENPPKTIRRPHLCVNVKVCINQYLCFVLRLFPRCPYSRLCCIEKWNQTKRCPVVNWQTRRSRDGLNLCIWLQRRGNEQSWVKTQFLRSFLLWFFNTSS